MATRLTCWSIDCQTALLRATGADDMSWQYRPRNWLADYGLTLICTRAGPALSRSDLSSIGAMPDLTTGAQE
jgi:hypothetical protein